MTDSGQAWIGKRLRRREDDRFLRGRGRYVDDLAPSGAVHAVFVRSPHPHARISGIDASAALETPGVLSVLTAADWRQDGLGDLPCLWAVGFPDGRPMNEATRPVFAGEKVCHVGDTVAAVVAENCFAALDAAELVDVDYEPIDAVTSAPRALEADAPVLHEAFGSNVAFEIEWGDRSAAESALAGAAHVTELRLVNNRVAPAPLEPRALVGLYDDIEDRYTLYAQSQNPHLLRQWLAENSLRIPEHKIRVVSPDVGGGFGQKIYHYPEEPVVLWAARRLGRPVRWRSTREENLLVDAHGRDHVTRCRMGFDSGGRIVGLWVDTVANVGAYLSGFGAGIPGYFYPPLITGLYDIPAAVCRVRAVYTNTTPVDAYRGAGRPEATYVVERLLENGARELGIDPCDLRAANFIKKEQFPYRNAVGTRYDTGDYHGLLQQLKAASGYETLRRRQTRGGGDAAPGRRLGIGLAAFADSAGGTPSCEGASRGRRIASFDSATVRVHPTGKVTVLCGGHSHGQGHATTFAQVVAQRLGCEAENVDVVEGDTDRVPFGHGTYGSRSLSVIGIAIDKASERILAKCRRIAAHLLRVDEGAVEFRDGHFSAPPTNRHVTFADVVYAAYHLTDYPADLAPGLEETVYHDPPGRNTPSAMHLCLAEVDTETGRIRVAGFWTVDDVGRVVNPMVVEGQVHGGVAQGVGQALLEGVVFDEDGQPVTGSFMDYAMPRADDLPSFDTGFQETPCPDNPLGAKGAGESGTIGAPAALANAVVDALWDLGITHLDMPLTPFRVWTALQGAGASRPPPNRAHARMTQREEV